MTGRLESLLARVPSSVRSGIERRLRRTCASLTDLPSISIGIVVAALTLIAFVVPENYRLVRDVVVLGDGDLVTRVRVFVYLLPVVDGFDPFVDGGLLAVSTLAGLAAATVVYQFRSLGGVSSASGGVSFGVLLGVVGGGCAACGSVFLAAAFGAGTTGLLAVLPYGGAEIPWIAAATIALSIVWITDEDEQACPVGDQ